MTPIETVAKAIEARFQAPGLGCDLMIHGDIDEFYQKLARAALEALREPSEAMLKAGAEGAFDSCDPDFQIDAKEGWQAMIDTALEEGQ